MPERASVLLTQVDTREQLQVGDVLGALVGHKVLGLKQLGKYILEAAVEEEGEDGMLVDSGVADKLMAAALHALARETSQDEMARQWDQTGLQLDAFFPSVCHCPSLQ